MVSKRYAKRLGDLHFLIDEGERRARLDRYFDDLGASWEYATLETGDVVEEQLGLGVERKSVSDLWQSIKDGRVEKQALRLLDQFTNPFIFVTGYFQKLERFYNKRTGLTASTPTLGMIASLLTRYVKRDEEGRVTKRIGLFGGVSNKHMVNLVVETAVRLDDDPIVVPRMRFHKKGVELAPVRMLMAVGMEEDTARKILSHFGSIEAVYQASEQELTQVRGIGPVKASYIFDAFRVKFDGMGQPA